MIVAVKRSSSYSLEAPLEAQAQTSRFIALARRVRPSPLVDQDGVNPHGHISISCWPVAVCCAREAGDFGGGRYCARPCRGRPRPTIPFEPDAPSTPPGADRPRSSSTVSTLGPSRAATSRSRMAVLQRLLLTAVAETWWAEKGTAAHRESLCGARWCGLILSDITAAFPVELGPRSRPLGGR